MSDYIQLYKKYRPRNWNEIIGQELPVAEIRKAIVSNRVPTAWAFFGGAGTGKTTCAKITAKALNCENLQENATPCNQCDTCINIDKDSQIGVTYISMANSGSVEEVRNLVSSAMLSQPIKCPVFILDEMQNLSSAAIDALLIPLEADNMNAKFIFCSTDPDKIKSSILSRMHAITFTPVHYKKIAFKLWEITQKENVTVSKDSIVTAAKNSRGSVRNAIVNLEKIINGGKLDTEFNTLIENALLKGNAPEIISLSKKMKEEGQNFTKTLELIYKDFTEALEIKAGITSDNKEANLLASKLSNDFIISVINLFGDTLRLFNNKVLDSETVFLIPLIKVTTIVSKKGKQVE